MEEEADRENLQPQDLLWSVRKVIRKCELFHTQQDKRNNTPFRTILLVSWEQAPHYTWTDADAEDWKEAQYTVKHHKVDWCVVAAEETSVPENLWNYPGDFPFVDADALPKDGEEVPTPEWVSQVSEKDLQEAMERTLATAASASNGGSGSGNLKFAANSGGAAVSSEHEGPSTPSPKDKEELDEITPPP